MHHTGGVLHEIVLPATAGLAAGLGVAMPLGAVAALLLREGLVSGFRVAAAGATGVAVVDTAYCALAVLAGSLASPLVEAHRTPFLVVAGVVVVVIGLRQLVTTRRRRRTEEPWLAGRSSPARAFATFVGLTAVNPMTLVYFVALAAAVSSRSESWVGPAVFVAAVGLASWGWQLVLAGLGSSAGRALGPRTAQAVGVVAALLVVVLGLGVAASALLG